MEAYVKAIDRAREALRWFVAGPEPKLLQLRAPLELRAALLSEIDAAQENLESQRPFLFIESAFLGAADEGWAAHVEELEAEFAELREEAAAEQPAIHLWPLSQRSTVSEQSLALAAFGARLEEVSKSVDGRLPGVVIVIAPAAIVDASTWAEDVRRLIEASELAALRWVVLDIAESGTEALAKPLEGGVESADVRPDAAALGAMLDILIAGMKSAPTGAEGHRLAGMAGPREAPPPRVRQAQPNAARAKTELAEAGAAGVAGATEIEVMQRLRIAVLEAARAFEQGKPSDGIRAQLEARDLCVSAGMLDKAALIELSLGAYLLQAGASEQALSVIEQARSRAEQAKAPELVAQTHLARAGALTLLQRQPEAADAYLEGGRVLERDKGVTSLLAIECQRLAGQLLLGLERPEEASAAFARAIQLATEAPPDQQAASSAPAAARELAKLYREQGLCDRAESLERQAEIWETTQVTPAQAAAPAGAATPPGAPAAPSSTKNGPPHARSVSTDAAHGPKVS